MSTQFLDNSEFNLLRDAFLSLNTQTTLSEAANETVTITGSHLHGAALKESGKFTIEFTSHGGQLLATIKFPHGVKELPILLDCIK